MDLQIESSNSELLEGAIATARQIAANYRSADVAGVGFLGAVVRGYFDEDADIDIAIFTRHDLADRSPPMYQTINGFQIHSWVADIAEEAQQPWPMTKRWAYSECQVYYDPDGSVADLLGEKVPLDAKEREWMLISGAALSEWYINRLAALWVKRGSLLSAHSMFDEGLSHFYNMLFALNGQLVPAHKWRIHYARRLPLLPERFAESIERTLIARDLGADELQRRVQAFMAMWTELLPRVEGVVGKTYDEFKDTV
jgi:hypothetical protein